MYHIIVNPSAKTGLGRAKWRELDGSLSMVTVVPSGIPRGNAVLFQLYRRWLA